MDTKRTRHATYHIAYHFVWTVKNRRPVLVGRITTRLGQLVRRKGKDLGGDILSLTIQPDHVRLFCTFPPTLAPHQVMHRLKGFTAHELRREFSELRSRLPSMWTRSYFVSTAGNVSATTIRRYLEAQKRRQ